MKEDTAVASWRKARPRPSGQASNKLPTKKSGPVFFDRENSRNAPHRQRTRRRTARRAPTARRASSEERSTCVQRRREIGFASAALARSFFITAPTPTAQFLTSVWADLMEHAPNKERESSSESMAEAAPAHEQGACCNMAFDDNAVCKRIRACSTSLASVSCDWPAAAAAAAADSTTQGFFQEAHQRFVLGLNDVRRPLRLDIRVVPCYFCKLCMPVRCETCSDWLSRPRRVHSACALRGSCRPSPF
jgi:hypothetical protein